MTLGGDFLMPIIIKAKANDSTSDLIRKFKKVTASTDIVQKVRDRAFHVKPSQVKKLRKDEKRRAQKRLRSLKKQKNITAERLERVAKSI